MTAKSRMVEFMAEGGTAKGFLASPEKPRGGVLVLHAWWGLNDFFKGYANRLASQGFLALAPDFHDGPVASTVEEAKDLHSKVDEGRVGKIVLGVADYLQSTRSISRRKIGVVGVPRQQIAIACNEELRGKYEKNSCVIVCNS